VFNATNKIHYKGKKIILPDNTLADKAKKDFRYIQQRAYSTQALLSTKVGDNTSLDSDYRVFFITETLPPEYHLYSKKRKPVFDSKFRDNLTEISNISKSKSKHNAIAELAKIFKEQKRFLDKRFRQYYNKLKNKAYCGSDSIKYFTVVESHHDFTLHRHTIFYVRRDIADSFLKVVTNHIPESECNIKELETNKSVIKYLLKSVNKSISGDSEKLIGFKKLLKRQRFISYSRDFHDILPIGIYRRIYNNLAKPDTEELLKKARESGVNLLTYISQNSTLHMTSNGIERKVLDKGKLFEIDYEYKTTTKNVRIKDESTGTFKTIKQPCREILKLDIKYNGNLIYSRRYLEHIFEEPLNNNDDKTNVINQPYCPPHYCKNENLLTA
jgi:hypothetical protein